MKKFLMTLVLAFATGAMAQDAQQPQQKTIKDPNEYNAFMSATSQSDPAQKAMALESFVQQYPNSIVKEDALVGAMSGYQQAGNAAKVAEAAAKVLQSFPNNIPALAVSVYSKRSAVNTGKVAAAQAPQVLAEAAQQAQTGLRALTTWAKPDGVSDADFQKQKIGMGAIFNGAIAQDAAARQDWPTAQRFFKEAVAANPNDFFDVYFAGVAYLSPKQNTQESTLTGLWYAARAAGLAPTAPQVAQFGKFYFKKYHGNEQGWDDLVAMAKTSPTPPADLATRITPAPTPAEQVAAMIKQNPNIETWSFGEWVLLFTYGSSQDKAASFERIKGKPFKFQGVVINATPETADIALTQDAIDAKKAEVSVTMAEPMKKVPAAGANFSFQANPVSYTTEPFMITMDTGVDLTPAAKPAKAAPKKAPAKRPARKKR